MTRFKSIAAAAVALTATLAVTGCSSSGGRTETESGGNNAGTADTPKLSIAMVVHAPPGDTFWDIIRKGAESAAAKDNVDLDYSTDPDAAKQAQLIQAAIDKKVDGIAVSDPNTPALGPVIQKAVAAGIPVSMFNAGAPDALGLGAIGFFGQEETGAGIGGGERAAAEGATKILCVIQTQGQQQLEDRCSGVEQGAKGATVERVNVNGTDDSAVTTAIQAKLTEDPEIDFIVTLGGPIALDAVKAVASANSKAKIGTFDTSAELVKAIQAGTVAWAIDQQPYLQGYEAVDSLWLYKTNGNTLGGGQNVLTGPSFVDKDNVDDVADLAAKGTR